MIDEVENFPLPEPIDPYDGGAWPEDEAREARAEIASGTEWWRGYSGIRRGESPLVDAILSLRSYDGPTTRGSVIPTDSLADVLRQSRSEAPASEAVVRNIFAEGRMKYCSHTPECNFQCGEVFVPCDCGYDEWLNKLLPAQTLPEAPASEEYKNALYSAYWKGAADQASKEADDGHAKECVEELTALLDRAEAAEAESDALRDLLRDIDNAIGGIFWTTDDGTGTRNGTPNDEEIPEYVRQPWLRLRALLRAEKPEATDDTTLTLGRGPNGRGIAVVEVPEARTCEVCGGQGLTAEHDPSPYAHDGEGNCLGTCPMQVECEHCQGTGLEPAASDGKGE